MLTISAYTSKQDLIKVLEIEADKTGDLILYIQNLPVFLNTKIAFTVFNYQISKYPRKILWYSKEIKILEFLKECSANIATQSDINIYTKNQYLLPTQFNNNLVTQHASFQNFEEVSYQTEKVQSNQPNYNQQAPNSKSFFRNNTELTNPQPNFNFNLKEFSTYPTETLSAETLLKKQDFNSSVLLDRLNQENAASLDPKQNLDSLLDRITSAKTALENIRNQDKHYSPGSIDLENSYSKPKINLFKIFSLSAGLSLFSIMVLMFFPTKVYTIEITPVSLEGVADINISVADFQKTNIQLTGEDSVEVRGKKELKTDRAIGQVSLVNNGGGEVDLDNGRFKLVSDNNIYYQVNPNKQLPSSFSIPGKYKSTDTYVFEVQSESINSNLPVNTKLDILNLRNQRVCLSCYAITISPIENTYTSGESYVSEQDKNFVTQKVDAKLAENIQKEIKNIQKEKVYTNSEWYKYKDTKYSYSNVPGDRSEKLVAKAQTDLDIYYLTQDQLKNTILSSNDSRPKEIEISNINILDIQSNPRVTDSIKLKILYNYKLETSCFDKKKFVDLVNSTEFDDAKKNLSKDCPEITNIDKKDSGINMPGIKSNIDLRVVKEKE